jgi:hypothetical protein
VRTATSGLAQLRPHCVGDARDLLHVVLNATSCTEANLALTVLREDLPERALVTACNLREVIRSLPTSPFAMRVDEQTLAESAGLERSIAAMGTVLDDGIELAITTAGNLVLDIIVRRDGEKYFWNPVPVIDDFVNTPVLDMILESDCLLQAMIDLTTAMGVVFNPKFYLSLEDWHLEYAEDVFDDLKQLF